tara:strand:- start:27 stop:518 length:492 start_codon:yes stop_codon:yes gene_type:complete
MAYFSEVRTDNNGVIRTIVVADSDVANNGGDLSVEAETWVANNIPNDPIIKEESGGVYPDTYWKQTSKQRAFRKNFAGPGYTYDAAKDVFISPQPYASWTLNESNEWQAPIAIPKQYSGDDPTATNVYIERTWDEENQKWIGVQIETDLNYEWNPVSSEWEAV